MKKSTLLLKGLAIACLSAMGANAFAANYVATSTGAWTSGSTWLGGVAPSTTVTGDNITVNGGVTVYLDQNVSISGASTLNVLGQLNSMVAQDLYVTGGAAFTGNGSVMVDSLVLGGVSAVLGATGNITARTITSLGIALSSAANITATESVKLANGLMNMTNGSFTLANNGDVYIAGGTVAIGGSASLNLNSYDVHYVDVSSTTGLELAGSGVRNIYIDVPSGSTVSLSAHTVIDDTLWLNSGVLNLNGSNLTFAADGNIGATGSGAIATTPTSNIMINADNSFMGELTFTTGSSVNAFVMNMSNSNATVMLGSDLGVTNQLMLTSGKLDVNGNGLIIGAGGTTVGGSANSYVITSDEGWLSLNVAAGSSDTFRIGTAANYSPVAVAANPGSAGGDISASVESGLRSGIFTGTNLASTQPVVNATWMVVTDASTNVNMNVTPMWPASLEVNGFNRTEAFVSANTNGTWDVMPSGTAATSGSLYSMTRSGVTSDIGAYSVMDKDAVNNVKEVSADKSFIVYPNPVVNTLYFKTDATLRAPVQVNIYDVTGHLVKTVVADNANGVSVADLSAGFYTAQFSSGEYKATEKFVKQ